MQSTEERERKIANILETYFSDASLLWDKIMLSKILADPDGMTSFESLCKLPKFRAIDTLPEEIKISAEKYSLSKLKFSTSTEKIGRIKPYIVNKKEELDDWSIYVEGLAKPNDNEQKITELFNSVVGHVSFFRIPPNQHGEVKFFGYCFIEFDNRENVEKAVKLVNQYSRSPSSITDTTVTDPNSKIADKLNLRVMSKLDWIKYRDEYVELSAKRKRDVKKLWVDYNEQYPDGDIKKAKIPEKPFKEGLIVFVDGLHLQCAKTTAISLLQTSGVNIAFMNQKKKGLSFTHIRLNNPEDAKSICDYFSNHHIVQETAKDTTGTEHDSRTFDCLKLRLLAGAEEEIYWDTELELKEQ